MDNRQDLKNQVAKEVARMREADRARPTLLAQPPFWGRSES
jgi:hypothetical protein